MYFLLFLAVLLASDGYILTRAAVVEFTPTHAEAKEVRITGARNPPGTIPAVPSYSQFADIASPSWQKVGCGITSLAMIIDYYDPGEVTVNGLLAEGLRANAYDYDAGWIYAGLIGVSRNHGLDGKYHDLTGFSDEEAFGRLETYVSTGPAIISVHYKFDPASTIPHLVVIDGIKDGLIYYNDPAAPKGEHIITKTAFMRGWKKKLISFWQA